MEETLRQEYSEEFDKLRKNRVAVSFHKYGPSKINFGNGIVDAVGLLELDSKVKYGCLEKCIEKYRQTGNTEYLIDAANYCMFEFMYPQHPDACFKPTESKESAGIVGISINEVNSYAESMRLEMKP